jgi:hypothetical protein
VIRRLRDVVADLAVVDLVRRFMDRPVVGERTARADRGLGLHQGSPLSPLLCNLYLDAFDRRMLALGYRAVRYADDTERRQPTAWAAVLVEQDHVDALPQRTVDERRRDPHPSRAHDLPDAPEAQPEQHLAQVLDHNPITPAAQQAAGPVHVRGTGDGWPRCRRRVHAPGTVETAVPGP